MDYALCHAWQFTPNCSNQYQSASQTNTEIKEDTHGNQYQSASCHFRACLDASLSLIGTNWHSQKKKSHLMQKRLIEKEQTNYF